MKNARVPVPSRRRPNCRELSRSGRASLSSLLIAAAIAGCAFASAEEVGTGPAPPAASAIVGVTCPETNTLEMNQCAYREAQALMAQVGALHASVQSRISTAQSKRELDLAQTYWFQFIDADCNYRSSWLGGGSARPFARDHCRAGHARRRIADLESYLACTGNGCPH